MKLRKKIIGSQKILESLRDDVKANRKFSRALFHILEAILTTKLVKEGPGYTLSIGLQFGDKRHFITDFKLTEEG